MRLTTAGVTLALACAATASPARAQGDIGGIIPTPENAPTRQGTRGANFLHLLVGARNNAMGGSVGGTVSGPESWFTNPAGAASAEGFSAAAGLQNLYGDLGLRQSYAAISMPLLGGVVGISLNTVNSGDIDRTSETSPLGDPRGGLTFNWTSTAVAGGYARRLTDRLTVGGQLKYITEGIPDASTSWVAFDAGTQFQTGIYGLVLGGSLANIGGQSRASGDLLTRVAATNDFSSQDTRTDLNTRATDLPTFFRFSVSENLFGSSGALFGSTSKRHTLIAEAAVTDGVDISTQLSLGAEYSFRNLVFARAGKRFFNDDRTTGSSASFGLSGGLGVRIPIGPRSMRFDYSYTSLGDLQNNQIFSFELSR